jgi:hypothetical protein
VLLTLRLDRQADETVGTDFLHFERQPLALCGDDASFVTDADLELVVCDVGGGRVTAPPPTSPGLSDATLRAVEHE